MGALLFCLAFCTSFPSEREARSGQVGLQGVSFEDGGIPDAAVHIWSPASGSRQWACFLSHYKTEAGETAKILKDVYLSRMLRGRSPPHSPVNIFLDSDNLTNLGDLSDAVMNSDILIVLASASVLTRPWCLFEIYVAMAHNVPVFFLPLSREGFSFEQAATTVQNLEEENPESASQLRNLMREKNKVIPGSFKSCPSFRSTAVGVLFAI